MTQSWADGPTLGSRTSIRDVLVDAERRLARAGIPSPTVDAGEIVAYVLGTSRSRLMLLDAMGDDDKVRVEQLLALRLSRVPLQHLTGAVGFRRIELLVGPGVFIPRPETELVVEAAMRALSERPVGDRIAVDLCSGSGAIALALATECPGTDVHAVEKDDDAVEWTRRNVAEMGDALSRVGSRVTVHHADAAGAADPGGPLHQLAGRVDVVASNPPYIPERMVPREPEVRDHEPAVALYGGADGLDIVREVARTAAILLRPGGLLVMEHADVQGIDAGATGVPAVVTSLACEAELVGLTGMPLGARLFTDVADRMDLNHLPRFTLATRAGEA